MRVPSLASEWLSVLEPPPDLTVSEWAEEFRMLPEASASRGGKWRNETAPYLAGIMDAAVEPGVRKMALMKSAQSGGSESLNNIIGYHVQHDPCPMLIVHPIHTAAEAWLGRLAGGPGVGQRRIGAALRIAAYRELCLDAGLRAVEPHVMEAAALVLDAARALGFVHQPSAEFEVLGHGHLREQLPALGHQRHALIVQAVAPRQERVAVLGRHHHAGEDERADVLGDRDSADLRVPDDAVRPSRPEAQDVRVDAGRLKGAEWPRDAVRRVAAALFLGIGLWVLAQTAGWIGA